MTEGARVITIDEYISIVDSSEGWMVKVGNAYSKPFSSFGIAKDFALGTQYWMQLKGTWRLVK